MCKLTGGLAYKHNFSGETLFHLTKWQDPIFLWDARRADLYLSAQDAAPWGLSFMEGSPTRTSFCIGL